MWGDDVPISELLSIYDEELNEIGVVPRQDVHSRGLLHQVVHCWMIGSASTEGWLYLQQRSLNERDFPGWYDIAVAGHVDVGESPEKAVLRETQEELGLAIDPRKLEFVGTIRETFVLGDFRDNEVCQVYLYPINENEVRPGDEVERIVKVRQAEFRRCILEQPAPMQAFDLDGGPAICIAPSQLFPHTQEYLETVLNSFLKHQPGDLARGRLLHGCPGPNKEEVV